MSRVRASSTSHRLHTRLEAFLAKQFGGPDNVDFYDQESYIEDNKENIYFKKFAFKTVIVCRDRIYLTDNPPKNLNSFVMFEDVLDIYIEDDKPKFLSGAEQENVFHVVVKCNQFAKQKRAMPELKRRVNDLKKSIVYTNSLDSKIVEKELNTTPRVPLMDTFRNSDLLQHTLDSSDFKFDSAMLFLNTNRTGRKSVRFEDSENNNNTAPLIVTDNKKLNKRLETDQKLDNALNTKYKKLLNMVELSRNSSSLLKSNEEYNSIFSVSLPVTPRSIKGVSLDNLAYNPKANTNIDNEIVISKRESYKLDIIENKIKTDFLKDSEKETKLIHLYFVTPKTRIFQSLRNAFYHAKIDLTLNYHDTAGDEETKLTLEKKIKRNNQLKKKFLELKRDLFDSKHDLHKLGLYYDELLFATKEYHILKKVFWDSSDLYVYTVAQIGRYLPMSPVNLKLDKLQVVERRIKELECAVTMTEVLATMFNETEFYDNRNEHLYEQKCKYMYEIMKFVVCDPELPDLSSRSLPNTFDFQLKLSMAICDLSLISGILLYEMIHFLSLTTWNSTDFTLEICVKLVEDSNHLELFLSRLINEMSKMMNDNTIVMLTAQHTVALFKCFSLLFWLIEKSVKMRVKKILRESYQEEFKYYFCENRIKLKVYNYYPIYDDLIRVANRLYYIVLG